MQKTHNATSVRYNAAIAAFNALKMRYADATRRENGIIKAGKKLHTLSARSPHPQNHWRTRLASLFCADKKREKHGTFWVHSNARTHDAHMREGGAEEQHRQRSLSPNVTECHRKFSNSAADLTHRSAPERTRTHPTEHGNQAEDAEKMQHPAAATGTGHPL